MDLSLQRFVRQPRKQNVLKKLNQHMKETPLESFMGKTRKVWKASDFFFNQETLMCIVTMEILWV